MHGLSCRNALSQGLHISMFLMPGKHFQCVRCVGYKGVLTFWRVYVLQMSCRYTLDVLLAGEDAPFCARRHLLETCFIVFASLGVALAFPTGAEKIFAVTGASCPFHTASFAACPSLRFMLASPCGTLAKTSACWHPNVCVTWLSCELSVALLWLGCQCFRSM
jgi:hypothetical protein